MSVRSEKLKRLAPILDQLTPDPSAQVSYELMSDALIWSDELPNPADRELDDTTYLRGVFRFRTTLILGNPVEKFRPSWDEAKTLFPNWPGFLADRQSPSPERV